MTAAATPKKPLYQQLYIQVLFAIGLGIVCGAVLPEFGQSMKPLGDAFIKLIKMAITPIIFCTVVSGIAHMGDMKTAGRIGIKSLVYFEVATTVALLLGMVFANVFHPGVGMNVDTSTLDPKSIASYLSQAEETHETFADFALGLIPQTVVSCFADGNLLQVLVVAILFAWALMGIGENAKPILKGIDIISHVFFRIIGIIMKLAPAGAFGAMAFTVGKYGLSTLGNLLYFLGLFYVACAVFVFGILGLALKAFTGLSIVQVTKYIKEELLIVLGTSSSETVMPRLIDKMERLGIPKHVVGMVVPTGYSFNLDGTSLYFTMAVMFLAQATNTHLTWANEFAILALLLVTSKGAAGVVGSAFIVLTGTLSALDGTMANAIPVVAVTILLGVDRFMSTGRALTNLVGYSVATLIIARWEKSIDSKQARAVLSGRVESHGETDVDADETVFTDADGKVTSLEPRTPDFVRKQKAVKKAVR